MGGTSVPEEISHERGQLVDMISDMHQYFYHKKVALVGDPELLFLDEPTTGFDPSARRRAWELVESLRALGATILLTTHYLDEAEQLADRVAVIVGGEIIREGSPAELTNESPETEIRYRRDGEEIVERTTSPTRNRFLLTRPGSVGRCTKPSNPACATSTPTTARSRFPNYSPKYDPARTVLIICRLGHGRYCGHLPRRVSCW